jgi:hypothetical protein
MWAELSILTEINLPSDFDSKLENRMTKEGNKRKAIDATYFRFNYEYEDQFIFCFLSRTLVFLVSRPESQVLSIHIENTLANSNLKLLKLSINDVAEQFIRFIKEMNIDIKEIKTQIYIDSDLILRGTRMNIIDTSKKILKENLTLDIFIAIVTFLISLTRGFDIWGALLNVVIVFGVIIIWLVISFFLSKDKFIYSEE